MYCILVDALFILQIPEKNCFQIYKNNAYVRYNFQTVRAKHIKKIESNLHNNSKIEVNKSPLQFYF